MEGFLVGNRKWTPAGESGGVIGWKIVNGYRLGNPDGVLARNSGRPPGWGNWTEFLSENVKVNCSVKWMEMWSDGLKEDVAWFNG